MCEESFFFYECWYNYVLKLLIKPMATSLRHLSDIVRELDYTFTSLLSWAYKLKQQGLPITTICNDKIIATRKRHIDVMLAYYHAV